jgi:hypothetical protein
VNLRAPTPTRPPPVRRVRPTLPPKSRTGAVRVDAQGRVVPGPHGYFWYGESIARSEDGPDGALYLLGGASVPHAAVVALAAVLDARQHDRERPGLPVADDWAARAWALGCHENTLVQHAATKLGERAFEVYRAAIDAAMGALIYRF